MQLVLRSSFSARLFRERDHTASVEFVFNQMEHGVLAGINNKATKVEGFGYELLQL